MKASIGLGVFGCPHPYALDGMLGSVSVKSSGTVDDIRDSEGFVVGHVVRDPQAEITLSGLVHGDNIPKFGDVMDMTFLNLTFYGLSKIPISKALVRDVTIEYQQAGYTAYNVQLVFHPLVNYVTNYYSTDPDMPSDVPPWLLDAFDVSEDGYITAFTVSDNFQIVTQSGKTPLVVTPQGVSLANSYPQLFSEALNTEGFAPALPDWVRFITSDSKGLTRITVSPDDFYMQSSQYVLINANSEQMDLASGVQTVTVGNGSNSLSSNTENPSGFGAGELPAWVDSIQGDSQGIQSIIVHKDSFAMQDSAGTVTVIKLIGDTISLGFGASVLENQAVNTQGFAATLPDWLKFITADSKGITDILASPDGFRLWNSRYSIIGASSDQMDLASGVQTVTVGNGSNSLSSNTENPSGFAPLDQALVTHDPLAVGALAVGAVNDLGLVGSVIDLTNMTLTAGVGRVPTCELAFEVGDTLPEVRQPFGLVWVDGGSFPNLETNRKYRFAVRVDDGVLIASDNYYFN